MGKFLMGNNLIKVELFW